MAKTKYPPFPTARQAALDLHLQSRQAYIDWHKTNNPSYLPRYPNRVYKEFISWNDWLGTQNTFAPIEKKNWRPWWEGVKWAQQYCADNDINTAQDWSDHLKKGGVIPDDIPRRPDLSYDDFVGNGWSVWLGKDVRAKLKAAKANTHIFAICSYWNLSVPRNVYAFVHAKNGVVEMREKIARVKDLTVFRTYYWDDEQGDKIHDIIRRYARDEGEGRMYCPNLNALIFELDNILEWYRHDGSIKTISETKLKIDDIEWSDGNVPSWKVDKV